MVLIECEPVRSVWSRISDGTLLHHPEFLASVRKVDLDPRADANLAPSPGLWLAIDAHRPAGYQCLGLAAICDQTGELEQLSQADDVPADFDLHPASVDYRITVVLTGFALWIANVTPTGSTAVIAGANPVTLRGLRPVRAAGRGREARATPAS